MDIGPLRVEHPYEEYQCFALQLKERNLSGTEVGLLGEAIGGLLSTTTRVLNQCLVRL